MDLIVEGLHAAAGKIGLTVEDLRVNEEHCGR